MPLQPLTTPHWIVFDLDETLAATEVHGFPILMATLQKALLKIDPTLPQEFEPFWAHVRQAYPGTGNIIHAISNAYGLPPEWEENIHIHASPPSALAVTANLQTNPALIPAMQQLKAHGHQLHILTLSHADYAEPVLHHLGLHAIFTPHIHTRAFKRNAGVYQTLLASYPHLAALPRMMVEDSPDNLAPAKHHGFTTIGIGYKTAGHAAVDHHFPTINDFLQVLLASNH